MTRLLGALARSLVSSPDEVRVVERSGGELLELEVADADRGSVIGRRGRTAEALRTLIGACARRRGWRCRVEIVG